MIRIELSGEEQEVLAQMLQSALATLEVEIRHTDRLEFRDQLKHRREILRNLLAKVPDTTAIAA